MGNFFSKAAITKLEPLVARNVQLLCAKLQEYAGSGRPVPLVDAFNCLTVDIIAEYAFLKRYRYLEIPDFKTPFYKAFEVAFQMSSLVKRLPWIIPVMDSLYRYGSQLERPSFSVEQHSVCRGSRRTPISTTLRNGGR